MKSENNKEVIWTLQSMYEIALDEEMGVAVEYHD